MVGVVLKVRYTPIEIHDFKIMLTEHLKAFLTLEKTTPTNIAKGIFNWNSRSNTSPLREYGGLLMM